MITYLLFRFYQILLLTSYKMTVFDKNGPYLPTKKDWEEQPEGTGDKGPYPSSELEKLEVIKLENIDKKLKAANRKVYAIEKNMESMKKQLEKVPKGLFHRKERRALEDKIATKQFLN